MNNNVIIEEIANVLPILEIDNQKRVISKEQVIQKANTTFSDFFRLSNSLYHDIFRFQDGHFYMIDESIDTGALKYDVAVDYLSVKIFGNRFEMILPFTPDKHGHMYMDYDFELSLQTCLVFYNHNIHIAYLDKIKFIGVSEGYQTYTFYNREVIMRRATIENIINY